MQNRTHTCNELRLSDAGKEVRLSGWMENVREVGGNLAFVVLRDFYGTTQLVVEDPALLARILDAAPSNAVFVVGHSLRGQEGLLAALARGRFPVFAIVPSRVSAAECARLREAEVGVLVSIESSGMGLYKSFAYEIFKRMPSALLAFDGNSAALNLIQEARNGRGKCRIFLSPRSRGLSEKAKLLEGYVQPLTEDADIAGVVEQLR